MTTRNAMKSIEELDKEVEELKKLEKDCTALRQDVLYMGVYQRRENLRMVLKKTLRAQKTRGKC